MKQFVFYQPILNSIFLVSIPSVRRDALCAALENFFLWDLNTLIHNQFFFCPLKTMYFLIIWQSYSQKDQSCGFFIQIFYPHSPLLWWFPSSHYVLLGKMQSPGTSLGRSNTAWKLFHNVSIFQSLGCISLTEVGRWCSYILKSEGSQHSHVSNANCKILNSPGFSFPPTRRMSGIS